MNSRVVWKRSLLGYSLLSFLLIFGLVSSGAGQGLPRTPDAQSLLTRGNGLDIAPSNPLAMPGSIGAPSKSSDSIFVSSRLLEGILSQIPDLEIGYLYNFGKNVRTGRLSLDYILPMGLGKDSAVFGEAHGEFTNFWKTFQRLFQSGNTTSSQSSFSERIDLSFGGGYRRLFNNSLLLGANGFYDTSKLGGQWYGSGGFGFEMGSLLAGNDMLDLNFNYYGNLFQGYNSIVNAFRNGTGNFNLEAGYSHELYEGGPDLRLKVTGYQFDIGTRVYGWNAGAELTTRNGLFSVRADTGTDRINGTYHRVGGFVNVGLQLERLLSGESPFVMPEPIFRSPRNLRRWLTRKVRRDWNQATAIVTARHVPGLSPGKVLFHISLHNVMCDTSPPFQCYPLDPEQLTGSGTLTMERNAAGYRFWSVSFVGDTASLPSSVLVTVTTSDGSLQNNYWMQTNNSTVTISVSRDTGARIGVGGDYVSGSNRPAVFAGNYPAPGVSGTLKLEAPGVETAIITILYP